MMADGSNPAVVSLIGERYEDLKNEAGLLQRELDRRRYECSK
jgi:hypothetical protein